MHSDVQVLSVNGIQTDETLHANLWDYPHFQKLEKGGKINLLYFQAFSHWQSENPGANHCDFLNFLMKEKKENEKGNKVGSCQNMCMSPMTKVDSVSVSHAATSWIDRFLKKKFVPIRNRMRFDMLK